MKSQFLSLSLLVSVFACSPSVENHSEPVSNSVDPHQIEIELNSNEKWSVNAEMIPFIAEGEKLVSEFISSESTDYLGLADALTTTNSALIKSCTMEGPSHDALHKWLHPHLELVKELKSKDVNPEDVVDRIQASYNQYHNYFQ